MAYIRKTRDLWAIEGNYGYGWEAVTIDDNPKDAKQMLRDYRENERGVPFRIRKFREKIQ